MAVTSKRTSIACSTGAARPPGREAAPLPPHHAGGVRAASFKRPSRLARGVLLTATALVWLAAHPAAAPARSNPTATLQRLGSRDYAVRQRATRKLLQDDTLTPKQIAGLYLRAKSLESRHRLLNVLRHHVLRRMRESEFGGGGSAAIGISHQVLSAGAAPDVEGGVVRVIATLPGFPGHKWFQPGDLIIKVGGKALPDSMSGEDFRDLLQRRSAGQSFAFTVLRDGQRVHFTLHAASSRALQKMYIAAPLLREPYRHKWLKIRNRLLAQAPPAPALRVTQQKTDAGKKPQNDEPAD